MNLVKECKFLTDGWSYEEGHVVPDNNTCRMVHVIRKLTRCQNVLEIGFNYGHSAYTFMSMNKELVYHSVDIGQYEHTLVNAKKIKEVFGDRFEFTQKSSFDIDPTTIGHYDMVFIDGDHSTEGMSSDMNLCRDAGVEYILIDDYVDCISKELGIYPKQLVNHYLSKPDFPYRRVQEFAYPATDGQNKMILLKRK